MMLFGPTYKYENKLHKQGYQNIAGLDEVGRGAWAGPVVAAAVILPVKMKIAGIRDSKLLSPQNREKLAVYINKQALAIGLGIISEKVIDRFEDVKMHVRKVLPEIPYIQDIPTDQQAKIIAENWKYHSQISPFIILYNSKNQKEKTFLENLAKALSVYFVPTKVIFANEIEKENRWEVILDPSVLKFIIAPDDQIWDLPHMMSHYSENTAKSLVFLDEVPLFLIRNLSMYFQDPTLKSSLWKAICQKVSALQLSL